MIPLFYLFISKSSQKIQFCSNIGDWPDRFCHPLSLLCSCRLKTSSCLSQLLWYNFSCLSQMKLSEKNSLRFGFHFWDTYVCFWLNDSATIFTRGASLAKFLSLYLYALMVWWFICWNWKILNIKSHSFIDVFLRIVVCVQFTLY